MLDRLDDLPVGSFQVVEVTLADHLAIVFRNLPNVRGVVGERIPEQLHLVRVPALDVEALVLLGAAVDVPPLGRAAAFRAEGMELVVGPAELEDRLVVDLGERGLEEAPRAAQVALEGRDEAGEAVAVAHGVQSHRVQHVLDVERLVEEGLPLLLVVVAGVGDLKVGDEVAEDAVGGLAIGAVGHEDVFAPPESILHGLRHHQRRHVQERIGERLGQR